MTAAVSNFLLDTSVVISPPSAGFPPGNHALSAITVAELEYGADRSDDPLERQRRRQRLARLTSAFDVLPFDLAAAATYGTMAGLVRAGGRNSRPRRLDLLIAATAVRHEFGLLTRNPDDFRHLERALQVVPAT
jgi:predicted nucleic acid-binding protein